MLPVLLLVGGLLAGVEQCAAPLAGQRTYNAAVRQQ